MLYIHKVMAGVLLFLLFLVVVTVVFFRDTAEEDPVVVTPISEHEEEVEISEAQPEIEKAQANDILVLAPKISLKGAQKKDPSKGDFSEVELAQKELAVQSPCLRAELKSDKKDIVAQIHEFKLPRTLPEMGSVCVFVDSKSVAFSKISNDRLRIDWKISKDSKDIYALYCNKGVKCNLKCPEPEKDFWDSITESKDLIEGTGFAENESSDEKELQKELQALREVLNRKPSQVSKTIWTANNEITSSCSQH
jgi:hypothetical protein